MKTSPAAWLVAAGIGMALVSGCVAEAPEPSQVEGSPAPAAPVSVERPPGFVDVVWRVAESPQVQKGQLYVFLSTGALVVASGNGAPSVGAWTQTDGKLATMTEEGITYRIEVVSLDARQFRIRSLNPGTPVELTLERASPDS
jgi:hypothetical protein